MILLAAYSVNQRLPSGLAVMPEAGFRRDRKFRDLAGKSQSAGSCNCQQAEEPAAQEEPPREVMLCHMHTQPFCLTMTGQMGRNRERTFVPLSAGACRVPARQVSGGPVPGGMRWDVQDDVRERTQGSWPIRPATEFYNVSDDEPRFSRSLPSVTLPF